MQIIHWFVFYNDYAYLIRLSDVTKPTIWPLPLQSMCKFLTTYNLQLPHFSTDLDENGFKIRVLLRSFILNIVIIRVAVPFKLPVVIKTFVLSIFEWLFYTGFTEVYNHILLTIFLAFS